MSVNAANEAEFDVTVFNFQLIFSYRHREIGGEFISYVLLNLKLTIRWNHELTLIPFHVPFIYISELILDRSFFRQCFQSGLLNNGGNNYRCKQITEPYQA